jgi:peptide/nickel transport system permease protein
MSTTYEAPATGVIAPEEIEAPSPQPGPIGVDIATTSTRAVKKGRPLALWLSFGWIGLVAFFVIFAGLLPLPRYNVIIEGFEPRAAPHFGFPELLGTDTLGRSVTSRLVYGARQSLTIGVLATALATLGGVVIGSLAGYFRGAVDAVVSVVLDAVLSIPGLLLLLAIAAVGQRNITTIVVALAILGIPTFSRLARATTLSLVDREHVLAARAMGARHHRIIIRELLPEVVLRILSYAFFFLAAVIVVEASLSFLRLGIPPPHPSWGGMVNDGRPYLQSQPYLVFIPAACIVFTVASFTVIGDWLRRRFDAASFGSS